MIVFPNGKINLGLSVLNKRIDGFHNIESVVYPVPIYDVLEFQPSTKFTLSTYGMQIPGKTEDNIVYKAWELLQDEYKIPPIEIKLVKGIPIGSGLGGGSSDAAILIKSLNEYFELGLSAEILFQLAEKLGSDCPFFIKNSVTMIQGRGEILKRLDLSLKGKHIVIVCPEIQISTQEAFQKIQPSKPKIELSEAISLPIEQWQDKLVNDFEELIFKEHPTLKGIKTILKNECALYTSLSGSGAAIYGIFDNALNVKNKFPDCFVWNGILN